MLAPYALCSCAPVSACTGNPHNTRLSEVLARISKLYHKIYARIDMCQGGLIHRVFAGFSGRFFVTQHYHPVAKRCYPQCAALRFLPVIVAP